MTQFKNLDGRWENMWASAAQVPTDPAPLPASEPVLAGYCPLLMVTRAGRVTAD